jgi:hypothetical protein
MLLIQGKEIPPRQENKTQDEPQFKKKKIHQAP